MAIRSLHPTHPTRFWLEIVLGAVSGVLGFLTIVWRDWLEAFGWDPDHGNGLVEWLIVAVLLAAAAACGTAARAQLRVQPDHAG